MAISEKKMKIVIENYFRNECNINTTIHDAFEKGFRIGVNKAILKRKPGQWINAYPDIELNPMFMYGICSECGFEQSISNKLNYCPNCGVPMTKGGGEK